MRALDSKYSMSVMLSISEMESCYKKDLFRIVTSPNTLDKLLTDLQKARLIEMREEIQRRRVYHITLTGKGRSVVKKLKEIDNLLNSD